VGKPLEVGMRRAVAAIIAVLCLCGPALADDMDDCRYWRLGKDDAEVASRRKACDRIIAGKDHTAKERAEAYSKRAGWDQQDNRPRDAIADLDQALALDPSQVEWRRDLAFLLYFDEQYDRAIQAFNTVLEATPEDGHATFFRGLAWLDKKDEARGFADLAKGIELAPNGYWYPYQRAVELAKRGRADEALPDLDKAISLKSSEVTPYLLRAEILDKRGETDKALADLTRAIEIDPKSNSAYMNRTDTYEKLGQLDRAIADYDKLISLNPGDPYYVDRKKALTEKLAARGAEPPSAAEPVAPAAAPPQAPAPSPPVAEPQPPPAPKAAAQAPPGKGECRRFDAIANTTISVSCPD
jgi:tetratricopeptide (TPR) repeat protein